MLCKAPRTFPKSSGGLLPCGHCMPCKINKRRDWTTRLILESQSHAENLWITLTYSDDHLPIDYYHDKLSRRFGSKEFPSLKRADYQNFFKRLRTYTDTPFKYFVAGEYGEKFHRPHYHICLFGLGDKHKNAIKKAWSIRDHNYKLQPIGNVFFGTLSWDSAQYTAGYTIKKMTSFANDDLHGRYPEFGQASKGLSLLAVQDVLKYIERFNLSKVPSYLMIDGKKVPVPRYMKIKLRQNLGISDEEAKKDWEEKMYFMRLRAKNSKTALTITRLYEEENRQSLLNQDAKLKLFYKKENLL